MCSGNRISGCWGEYLGLVQDAENGLPLEISRCDESRIVTKPTRRSSRCRRRLTERPNGYLLVVHDVEDAIPLCNLQQAVDLVREVEQLKFSLLLAHARESADQMAYPRLLRYDRGIQPTSIIHKEGLAMSGQNKSSRI